MPKVKWPRRLSERAKLRAQLERHYHSVPCPDCLGEGTRPRPFAAGGVAYCRRCRGEGIAFTTARGSG